MNDTLLQLSMALLCLSTIGLHVVRKNRAEVILYSLQSFAVVALLVEALARNYSLPLILIVVVTFGIKVVFAPCFFNKLITRHKIKSEARAYANIPWTLFVLTGLFLMVNSPLFAPLVGIAHENHQFVALALWLVFASVFLMANRKGALSQATGVLSLENSIVVFGVFTGLEQSAVLQMGVMFDVLVWLIIAMVMTTMVYKHVGSLDVTKMKDLRE